MEHQNAFGESRQANNPPETAARYRMAENEYDQSVVNSYWAANAFGNLYSFEEAMQNMYQPAYIGVRYNDAQLQHAPYGPYTNTALAHPHTAQPAFLRVPYNGAQLRHAPYGSYTNPALAHPYTAPISASAQAAAARAGLERAAEAQANWIRDHPEEARRANFGADIRRPYTAQGIHQRPPVYSGRRIVSAPTSSRTTRSPSPSSGFEALYGFEKASAATPRSRQHLPRALIGQKDSMAVLDYVLGFSDVQVRGIPRDVVFVCHDFEAYSPAHNKEKPVTEGGVAFFDTRVLCRVPKAGQNGENWIQEILPSHVRIEGLGHKVNRKYAVSCGDKFNFGKSQWVPKDEMRNVLTAVFDIPDVSGAPLEFSDLYREPRTCNAGTPRRNVIVVGHAAHNDDQYMREHFGVDYSKFGNVVAVLDTQVIGARPSEHETIAFPALVRLTRNFGIKMQDMHNSGNDAVYTLAVMLLQALEHIALQRGNAADHCVRTKGPTNAEPALDALMRRCQSRLQTNATDCLRYYIRQEFRGLRCEVCGRRNQHATETCTLWSTCGDCGTDGHSTAQCQPHYRDNAKHGFGDGKRWEKEDDRKKHNMIEAVRKKFADDRRKESNMARFEDIVRKQKMLQATLSKKEEALLSWLDLQISNRMSRLQTGESDTFPALTTIPTATSSTSESLGTRERAASFS